MNFTNCLKILSNIHILISTSFFNSNVIFKILTINLQSSIFMTKRGSISLERRFPICFFQLKRVHQHKRRSSNSNETLKKYSSKERPSARQSDFTKRGSISIHQHDKVISPKEGPSPSISTPR